MSVETLGSYAGIVLSLFMAYVPGVREWYDRQSAQMKATIMGGLLIVVALAVFGVSCGNLWPLVECSVNGAKGLFLIAVNTLIANQATYLLAVKPFKS